MAVAKPPHLEVIITARHVSVDISNKYYFIVQTGSLVAADMQSVADWIQTKYVAPILSTMARETTVYPPVCKYQNGASYFESTGADGPETGGSTISDPGEEPAGMMPEQNAVVLQKRTNLGGRSKRGRWFFGFVPELFAVDSTLNDNAVGQYQTLAKVLLAVQTITPISKTLLPVHYDAKNNAFHQLTQERACQEIMSRRDRRYPKWPLFYNAAT